MRNKILIWESYQISTSSANYHRVSRALGKDLASVSFSAGLNYIKLIVDNHIEMIIFSSFPSGTHQSMVVKSKSFGAKQTHMWAWFCHLLTLWPRASYWTSLSFLVPTMGRIIGLFSLFCQDLLVARSKAPTCSIESTLPSPAPTSTTVFKDSVSWGVLVFHVLYRRLLLGLIFFVFKMAME